MRLAFDIETNGLLPELTTAHSLCIKDLDTSRRWSLKQEDTGACENIADGVKLLQEADYITGHNIVSYDIPALQKLYPWFEPKGTIRDTFIMAKMIWPTDRLRELDMPRWVRAKNNPNAPPFPGQLLGAHRLEAWGYRLDRMKGEYSATVKELSKEFAQHGDITKLPDWARALVSVDGKGLPCLDPWKAWNQPMQDYCDQDVEVTHELHTLIEGHLKGTVKTAFGIGWSERSVELEHRTWKHIEKETERGFGFDLEGGIKLAAQIKNRQAVLEEKLIEAFGSWWQPLCDEKVGKRPARAYQEKATWLPDVTIRRFGKNGKELKPYVGPPLIEYNPDWPFVPISWTTFNPKSRQHLGERLQKVYGWVPTEWGGKDEKQAKVDETTLKSIPSSVLPDELRETILEFLVNAKTLGQLSDGTKSWIGLVREDGRLHGRMDTLGTVSHRGAHMDPNKGQVPSVTKKKQEDGTEVPVLGWKGGFGIECRTLWRPGRPGWRQTGVDCSGLELRMLGHYLAPHDKGEFARRVSTPGLDIHAENAKITGLSRAETKTVTYAFLYGAGALKIGLGVGVPEDQIEELANSGAAKAYLAWAKRTMRNKFIRPDNFTLAHIVRGQQVKKAFLDGITGLKELQEELKAEAEQYGFIVAIDGRKLSIRSPHVVLNQALQGGGAIVCKEWMLETDRLLVEHYGLAHDVDFGQMAWVHDELQFEHREEAHGQIIQEASKQAVRNVAQSLSFRGELDTDGRTGWNWAETH
jgi:DNA polymerase-1